MRIFLKIIYGVAFYISICISAFRRSLQYILSITYRIAQWINFRSSRRRILHKHQDEFDRIIAENTREHLRELVNVLKKELNMYRNDISPYDIYKLRRLIERDYRELDLGNLTIVYKIFFETSKTSILPELEKLVKTRAFSDNSGGS